MALSIDNSGRQFYNVNDMLLQNRDFFRGFKTKPKDIIDRKQIPVSEYVYAIRNKTNEWTLSESCKGDLFLTASWVDSNFEIPRLKTDKELDEEDLDIPCLDSDHTGLSLFRSLVTKHIPVFSCIYLISLGKVIDVRNDLGISDLIDDNKIVYKYGRTDDIHRRLDEHKRYYAKYKSVKLEPGIFQHIDPAHTVKAEAEIRDFFDSFGKELVLDGKKELVALNKKELDRVKKEYGRTGREYSSEKNVLDLNHELSESRHEINRLTTLVESEKREKYYMLESEKRESKLKDSLLEAKDSLLEAKDREKDYLLEIAKREFQQDLKISQMETEKYKKIVENMPCCIN